MKKFIMGFLRRGLLPCGIGPIVLVIFYLVLKHTCNIEFLTVEEVSIGIFSISVLAFVAGGMNSIYQIESLPLMLSILIHGVVLYISYLITYLINDWIDFSIIPIIVFSVIFVVGYIVIWISIYLIIKRNTAKINAKLNKNRQEL